MTTLTRPTKPFTVLHSRRIGDVVAEGPAAYGPWADSGILLPGEVRRVVAPGLHLARCELDIATLATHCWRWRNHLGVDDRIAVVAAVADETDPDNPTRLVLFAGFVVEGAWQFGAAQEHASIAASSTAARLARDQEYLVYGRYMLDANADLRFCTGLPCEFNYRGLPNRHPTLQHQLDPAGEPRGVPVFAYDGDPAAVYWTLADAMDYLWWRYNTDETWIANHTFLLADYARDEPICVGAEGLSLWEALAAVADKAGYDVYEQFTWEGGEPFSQIVAKRRGTGPERSIKHQAEDSGADGGRPNLDLASTNLFTASVCESVASAVTAPVVAGGAKLFEITAELGKAWDPARLSISGTVIVPPGQESASADEPYVQKYCTSGTLFTEYADVARLWDANSDGRYTPAPWELPEADVADLADQSAGTWPAMPYKPLPALSWYYAVEGGTGASHECLVEVSFDDGATWRPLDGFRLLPDRLGICLTPLNLAEIVDPASGVNLMEALTGAHPEYVRLWLTCTVAAPDRNVVAAARRDKAGTAFLTGQWVDRGALGQVRTRATGSSLADQPADEADLTDDLTDVATAFQDAGEDRSIEAALHLEWPDEEIELGDTVPKVGGINYDLRTNSGPALRSPRVVAIHHLLTIDTWSMSIVLGTERMSGVAALAAVQERGQALVHRSAEAVRRLQRRGGSASAETPLGEIPAWQNWNR